MLPAAVLTLASCSNDKVVEQNPSKVVEANALQIYPEIQGITRGPVWDNSNFKKFYLTTDGTFQTDATTPNSTDGSNKTTTFSQQLVEKDGGTWQIGEVTVTTSSVPAGTTWYWPSKSSSSSFTAWAPYETPAFLPGSYTASTAIANQKDILVAYNTGSATDFEAGVPLKFRHILSQIVIKADNAAKNKIQIKVKDVRLNNIKSVGTWALPTASTASALGYNPWSSVATEVNYLTGVGTTTAITLDGSAKDLTGANPLLLIPQQLGAGDIEHGTGQYLSVLVQIQNLTGANDTEKAIFPKINVAPASGETLENQNYAWAAVDVNTEWEPGKKYIYTLHFTENGYGKVDKNQNDDGDDTPGVDPGEDVVDAPVKLVLDVEVIDWTDVTEEHNM